MKRQSKWVTLLALVVLCAQMTGALASDSESEWQYFTGDNDMPLISPVEPVSAVPMTESHDIPDGANTPLEPLSPINPIEGDGDDCTHQHEPAVYSTIEPEPQVTQPPQPATPDATTSTENVTIVPGVFPTPGALTAGYPVTDETITWGELGEVTSLNKKPTPVLSTMDTPPGLRWTSVEGADRYVLELTITPTNGDPYGETIYIEGISVTSYCFTPSQLDGAQSISALMYAEQYSPCTHSGILRISNSSNTVTCTLAAPVDETQTATPVLSFDPDALTFTWTEVEGAIGYTLDVVILFGDNRPDSMPITRKPWPGLTFTLADMSRLEGATGVCADVYALFDDGRSSVVSNEIKHTFDEPFHAPTWEDMTGIAYDDYLPAPILAFDMSALTFSWSGVEGAYTYELYLQLEYADDSKPYGWSVCKADPTWQELSYTLEDMDLLEGAVAVTGYVTAINANGLHGSMSNHLRYPIGAEADMLAAPRIYYDNKQFMLSWIEVPGAVAYEIHAVVSNDGMADAVLTDKVNDLEISEDGYRAYYFESIIPYYSPRTKLTSYIIAVGADGTRSKPSNTIINDRSATAEPIELTLDTETMTLAWTLVPGGEDYYVSVNIQYADGRHGGEYPLYTPDVTTHKIDAALLENASVLTAKVIALHRDENLYRDAMGASDFIHHQFSETVAPEDWLIIDGGWIGGGTGTGESIWYPEEWMILDGGWLSSGNVGEDTQPAPQTTVAAQKSMASRGLMLLPGEYEFAEITSNTINIRSTATSSRSNPMGEVQRGEIVIVLDRVENEEGVFVEIQTYTDITGFIPEAYAETYESDDAIKLFETQTISKPAAVDANTADVGGIPENVYQHFASGYAK